MATDLLLMTRPHISGAGGPRARVRRAFAAFHRQLSACRLDPELRFTVSDLESLRAFLSAHCEERPFVRELLAAGRVEVTLGQADEAEDPVLAEWQRRSLIYARAYYEGLLGGSLEAAGRPEPPTCGVVRLATAAILRAEKAATLATLAGARYPELALDRAWRQVLAARDDEAAEAPSLDLLAACREVMELAEEVSDRALSYLAQLVNTAAAKGATHCAGSLVVFSLSGNREVTMCRARVQLSGALAAGFELLDVHGREVRLQLVSASRMGEANWVEISFRAADLPCVGYATYGLRPTDRFPEPASLNETPPAAGSAVALQTPVQAGPLPAELDLVSVDAPNVTIVAMRPTAEEGVLVRAHECEGRAVNAVAAFGGGLEQVWRADAQERKVADFPAPLFGWRRAPRVPLTLGPCESTNLVVALKRLAEVAESADLGPTDEPCRTIYCRYWDHNLGTSPVGNMPLGLWTNGTLPLGQNLRFPVSLSNDSLDREFVGTVQVLAPEGWTLRPRQIPYRLPPGSQALYEIAVDLPEDAPPCFVRLEAQADGVTLQDVLPVGDILPLEVTLTRDDGGFTVTLANPNPDYVEGQVALITPLETWGKAAGAFSRASITPRSQAFTLAANGSAELRFTSEGDLSRTWAVTRVAWYGRVQYARE